MTDDESLGDEPEEAPTNKVSLAKLRARAEDSSDQEAAAIIQEMAAKIRDGLSFSSFTMPAVERLQASNTRVAEHRQEMERAFDEIAEVKEAERTRAQTQTDATIEIAEAQKRLQEMQAESLVLATEQATATARVAEATVQVAEFQQELLASHGQELEVLRAQAETLTTQAETLREQAADQKTLIRSGFASGVVMEWTLVVALLAFVATVIFALVKPSDIPAWAWPLAVVVLAVGAFFLIRWQRKRRPANG